MADFSIEMTRRPTTLYLEWETYQRFKDAVSRVGKSASQEINDYIRRRLAELEGEGGEQPGVDVKEYEDLRSRHGKLAREMDSVEKRLRKRKVYEDLLDLAGELGLDAETFSNLYKVIDSLLERWDGTKEDLHQFITYLELAKEKREIEHNLEEIRRKIASSQ